MYISFVKFIPQPTAASVRRKRDVFLEIETAAEI